MAEAGIVGQVAQATATIPIIGRLPFMVRIAIIVTAVVVIVLIILQCVLHKIDILPFCKPEKTEQTEQANVQQSATQQP